MIHSIKDILRILKILLKSKYKWLLLLFSLWLYRVDFLSDTGTGLGKLIQVISIFGMLYIVCTKQNNIVSYSYNKTSISIKSLLWFYSLAVVSTAWAYIPQFAFFLSFQNLVLIFVLIWTFSRAKHFLQMEKLFLYSISVVIIFEMVSCRFNGFNGIITHFLPTGSSSAILFSYSIAEYIKDYRLTVERKSVLRFSIFLSILGLVTSTSSGANASALLGFAIALIFSRKIIYGAFMMAIAGIIYFNQDIIDSFIFMLMPGKDADMIKSSNGRQIVWDFILDYASQKPVFGWGYACVERLVGDKAFDNQIVSDAHNNYIGIYGSLGLVGLFLLIYHLFNQAMFSFKNRLKPGYLGILCATCCSALNGYSYGFLSGKACSITVCYFAIVVLSYTYSKVIWLPKK